VGVAGSSGKLTVVYERNDEGDRSSVRETRSGVSPLLIAFIVLAVLAVVFVLQNGERTDINFLFFDFGASVWVAIAIAIGVGILLDRLFLGWWRRRRQDR
jgi:uncharacterized integral membrane protein